jgi:RsiW-degrading membrane proteinase PrsW (M82 family)
MPISIECPACGRRLKANDALAGRRLPCPSCRSEVEVPAPASAEETAAALLLESDAAAPAAPPPEYTPMPVPAAPAPASRPGPVAIKTLPPLRSNEPPAWLRHLHWALALALIPLAVTLLRKGDDDNLIERLQKTIAAAPPEAQPRILADMDAAEDVDGLLRALPRQRLTGAALGRDSWWHWGFAALAAGLFLGFFVLLATGGVADPRHLVGVGLFTGTIGILVLVIFQAMAEWSAGVWPHGRGILTILLYLVKLIGLSYRVALDPENGFWLSFVGFTAGVGLCEEIVKAVPAVAYVARNPDADWRGAFLWGLASGAGFGIAEGIMYSSNYYNGIHGGGVYVVRFASCVALHALWTGSVAIAAQQRRHWIDKAERWVDLVAPVFVYMFVPMILHGLYDTLLKKEMTTWALVVALLSFGYLAVQIYRLHGVDTKAANAEMLREYKRRRKATA